MTYSFATLAVSRDTYEELANKLSQAGYAHAFLDLGEDEPALDMHGIGLVPEEDLLRLPKVGTWPVNERMVDRRGEARPLR